MPSNRQTYQRKCFRVVPHWNLENLTRRTTTRRSARHDIVASRILRPASYRRVWSIGRIHFSKVHPEPQCDACETALHFCIYTVPRSPERYRDYMEAYTKPLIKVILVQYSAVLAASGDDDDNTGGTGHNMPWDD